MDSLQTRLADIVEELTYAGDWTDRYRLLVEWGEAAGALPEADCLPEWEVSGCSSPLWLRVQWSEGRLAVRGASPGILPKALVALVMRLFDGLADAEGKASDLIDRLDLSRHLSPTRLLVLTRMLDRVLSHPRTP
jgi:cysteine desulfuration protein SufE